MTPSWPSRREPAGHADDWLMTYADMITLLLCCFVIFLTVSSHRREAAPTPVPIKPLAAVTAPIPPPVLPPRPVEPPPPAPEALQVIPPFDDDTPADQPATASAVTARAELPAPRAKAVDVPPAKPDAARAPAPASLPELVDRLKPTNAAEIRQKGDRLTTIEVSSAAFFSSGSASLSGAGKSILQQVAANLLSDKFKSYRITVEGHTDDTPINTAQFPSNWELSTARASAVVRFLLEQGVPAQRLRAAGYADTFPKVPNRDAEGRPIPENQALNRRVVIKLEKID